MSPTYVKAGTPVHTAPTFTWCTSCQHQDQVQDHLQTVWTPGPSLAMLSQGLQDACRVGTDPTWMMYTSSRELYQISNFLASPFTFSVMPTAAI